MKKVILAGFFALSASTALAQTNPAPQPAAPAPQAAPSTAPASPAPSDQAASQPASGPANLCQELVAFMKAPPPQDAAKPAAAPAKPAAQGSASAKEGSSALAGTSQAGDGATTKPENQSNSAQKVTGQDGVATDAPKEGKDNAASGSVANAPQKESRPAPVPPADVSSTPKESVMTVEAAEELATANDIAACQDMARKMRVAGVSMPPPLIALAALDLQYQQGAGANAAPSGATTPAANEQAPAASGQAPASNTQDQ